MIKILFICHGNICRSTMSQYVFQDMVHKINLTAIRRERYSGSWISRSVKARILRIRGIQVILILHTGT